MDIEDYQNKFVAFIDILGFKDLIKNIEAKSPSHEIDAKKVWSILNFLNDESIESNGNHDLLIYEKHEKGLLEKELGNPVITYVSDCVVITTDGNFDGFKSICNKITKFYTDVATDGIYLRGAITYGKVYHTGRFLFGTGYQRAYHIESTIVDTPRIIIDKSVTDFLKDYQNEFPLNINGSKEDEKGIKYLRPFPLNYYPYYVSPWDEYLKRVKSNLLYHLNKFDTRANEMNSKLLEISRFYYWKHQHTDIDLNGGNDKILAKYIWLANEFNETLEIYSKFLSDENGKMKVNKIGFDDNIWSSELEVYDWDDFHDLL